MSYPTCYDKHTLYIHIYFIYKLHNIYVYTYICVCGLKYVYVNGGCKCFLKHFQITEGVYFIDVFYIA